MPIPDYESLMPLVLRHHEDGFEHRRAALRDQIAQELGLTTEELEERLPSGKTSVFASRLNWAVTYLGQAGVLDRPRRGMSVLSERGRQLLNDDVVVDNSVLERFEEFRDFKTRSMPSDGYDASSDESSPLESTLSPVEQIERAAETMTDALAAEVVDRLLSADPEFLEDVVVELMLRLGYGSRRPDEGQRLGRSGDGGLDGIIREDALGLDSIYLQAKRWARNNTVGRPEVQAFVGALHGVQASKGVFITTSTFSREAADYVAAVGASVVLIDGRELARLMIDHDLGVSTRRTVALKAIDEDYFIGPEE